ncbi:1-phosphatidylinositol-4,5-bisphosphate phosphodiesterase beta-2 [Gossypium australe]|uniref:1-phosphatidylinositol-4,5-bisphosphate phosphodiesterase beta-2 n=1 Tax=Gossypium australe TaxID=47621 RepID=A0A5B6VVS7_9ROSI|nr:1-phosphatidylinositol-4,5-bisphosphate phosphodiesterase beta-2 [Gossypium australe]
MSTRGTRRRGTRGCGRGRRGARVGSSSSGNLLNLVTSQTPASPVTKKGSHDRAAGDDALSQAMLRILERVAGPNIGIRGRGSIIAGVAPNMAEYWIEGTKRIMDDLDCTFEQKLKGVVLLL